ncbi:MAG TPA: hypothetical protein VIJ79_14000 [Acidobacteriaceae bacterium]
MPTIDENVVVVRDADWQYVRIPLSVNLPGDELELHQDRTNGPVTLSPPRPELTPRQRVEGLERAFAMFDAARAAGETFEIERDFCPPRDVDL